MKHCFLTSKISACFLILTAPLRFIRYWQQTGELLITLKQKRHACGKASVYFVIIGFGLQDVAHKTIYEYADIKGETHAVRAVNINPYLVDAPDLIIEKSRHPICAVLEMTYGRKPTDGGNLLFTAKELAVFIKREPLANNI